MRVFGGVRERELERERTSERKGREGCAKGAKKDKEETSREFFCVFCETFASFAFGCPLAELRRSL
jgi:hypothetical protein